MEEKSKGKENFKNQKFITRGVDSNVSLLLQLFMWQCIEDMPQPKDYLQVFECTLEGKKQKIIHSQEEPDYKREYLLNLTDAPLFIEKIFVIDDGDHSTILYSHEY